MIRSMTGYGRAQATVEGMAITVEIKTVNHRYYEFTSRITRGYGFLEEKIKAYLQTKVQRGKMDVYVGIETVEAASAQVMVNHSLAQGYVNAIAELSERYGIPNDLTAGALARYPDLFTVHKAPEDEQTVWNRVLQVLEPAAASLVAMRESEGARLQKDVEGRMRTLLQFVEKVEHRSPQTVQEYKARLQASLQELLGDVPLDPQRILTEAAIFADKIAVAEETVRLRSHFTEMESMLRAEEPIGRKLDFVVQELNRETNTIGSKAQDAEIAHWVIEMKAEIEKIREQIQNIE